MQPPVGKGTSLADVEWTAARLEQKRAAGFISEWEASFASRHLDVKYFTCEAQVGAAQRVALKLNASEPPELHAAQLRLSATAATATRRACGVHELPRERVDALEIHLLLLDCSAWCG